MSRVGRQEHDFFRAAAALALAAVLTAAPAVSASAQEGQPEQPINITADRMEYFSDKDLVIFTGNALAVRGDSTLSADSMEVTLSGEGGSREESSVEQVVATGNVNFRQVDPETDKERYATGERGVYDAGDDRIRQTTMHVSKLLFCLLTDDGLEIPHQHRVGVGSGDRANDVMGGINIGDPVAHGFVERILERF